MDIIESVKQAIIKQAQAEAPIESCGYLLGTDDTVTENYPMTNIDHSEEHFSFDPREQFAALKYARQKGLRILANWHSHPASPRLANDPTIRYAILSLQDGDIRLNSFKIINREIIDKEIHI